MELLRNNYESSVSGPQGEVWFELFGKYIQFGVEEEATLEYVKACAEYLNALPEATIKDLCEASIRYCNGFLADIGEPLKSFDNYKSVLSLIYPSTLIIPEPEYGDEPVIWMELNCEWEQEHGMQWVVRNNEVLYVGGFNGTDPWAEISKSTPWNYA